MDAAWVSLKDDELLRMRICDLDVKIEGSDLEPRVHELYEALDARGLRLRPQCYLGDEWFAPTDVPKIAIPFYLAHPRLRALERHQMLDVEGEEHEHCMKLLRHECGHAYDHAYLFSKRRTWRRVFGSPDEEYTPEHYRPRPYSKSFVRHLPNWYAQAHPEEDFAETFAVWLGQPQEVWRARYRGWRAIEKLEYVDAIMKETVKKPPLVTGGRASSDASKMKTTLARYYAARRKLWAEDHPDFYDVDLRKIFREPDLDAEAGERGEPATRFMRRHRARIVDAIVQWTGQRKYVAHELVQKLIARCARLNLVVPHGAEVHVILDVGAYLSALVTNHLHTGRFKRSV